jgi:tripartite-type tricarboxylate transporter receptor subunit TctC
MRVATLPDVPTVTELGYAGVEEDIWIGLVAPARTPQQTVSQLASWFTAAAQAPEVKTRLAVQGLYPVGMCGVDFATHLRKYFDEYGRVIREANIKAE